MPPIRFWISVTFFAIPVVFGIIVPVWDWVWGPAVPFVFLAMMFSVAIGYQMMAGRDEYRDFADDTITEASQDESGHPR